jgi:hypothetical protein
MLDFIAEYCTDVWPTWVRKFGDMREFTQLALLDLEAHTLRCSPPVTNGACSVGEESRGRMYGCAGIPTGVRGAWTTRYCCGIVVRVFVRVFGDG